MVENTSNRSCTSILCLSVCSFIGHTAAQCRKNAVPKNSKEKEDNVKHVDKRVSKPVALPTVLNPHEQEKSPVKQTENDAVISGTNSGTINTETSSSVASSCSKSLAITGNAVIDGKHGSLSGQQRQKKGGNLQFGSSTIVLVPFRSLYYQKFQNGPSTYKCGSKSVLLPMLSSSLRPSPLHTPSKS